MPDFKGFSGRGFQDGNFRDVNVEPDGTYSSGPSTPPQKKRDTKRIASRVVIVVLILLLAVTVMGSYYNVSEQENAVVTMFGKVVRTDTAGLYFKIPFLQQVHMVDITTHGSGIG